MIQTIRQSLSVPFDYPVLFCRGLFAPANRLLADVLDRRRERRRHRVAVYLDAGLLKHNPSLKRQMREWFAGQKARVELAAPPRIVPGGEAVKNSDKVWTGLVRELAALRLCRHSFVVIVGGGAALDAVGFAASLVHRGLRVVRVPTTALAQCDSGVGVKTAVNWAGTKNLVGTFAPPFAVINDSDFLETLPDREWRGGIAEAFKVAIIKDAGFFRFLCANAKRLRERDSALMERAIVRCARLHLHHIRSGGDPFELGRARPLDFGHWAAHKLESLSGYKVGHGQAVAAGVALDSIYAARMGWLSEKERDAILRGLTDAGLPVWYDLLLARTQSGSSALWDGLDDFREHLGGELCITYPKSIGSRMEVHTIDKTAMRRSLEYLKRWGGSEWR